MISKQGNEQALTQYDDIETYLNVIFNNTGDPIFVKDEDCKLLLINDAFCKVFGVNRDIIGTTLAEKVPKDEREHFLAVDRQVLRDGKEAICEESLTINGENSKTILTRKNRFTDSHGNYFIVGVIHDITERKHAEEREKARAHVLELITSGKALTVILEAIIQVVEQKNPNMLCSILLLDDTGEHLLSGAASSLPNFYNEAIDGITIGIGVGSCGTAAFTNERVIVEDIQTHPYWQPYKELAKEAKLAACWSEPIRSAKGDVLGTFAIYHREKNYPTPHDLAVIEQTANLASIAIEKKLAEDKIKLAATVFSHAREGIIITDATGKILKVNDRFTEISGYSRKEAIGQNPRILQSGKHSPSFYRTMWHEIITNHYWTGEIYNRHKNGQIYTELQTINTVRDEHGIITHFVALGNDITIMKEHQNQLEHIAHYDLLTNLPNRVLLADRLSQAILQCNRQNESLAVVFLDLDGFKHVNDAYGHDIGDKFLVSLSLLMKDALRECDSLARIGGDEFVAVLTDIKSLSHCEQVIERLLIATSTPVTVNNIVLNVSASIGVTLYPKDNVGTDQLIRHADQAMYIAKDLGKNQFHLFDTVQDSVVKMQQEVLESIRIALDSHQFVLYYQPKVNMRTGQVIGVEALIRWQHPQRGLLSPIEFLPAIENNPMIIEVGEWVIAEALRQINQWQQSTSSLSLSISVNIAAVQLQQPNFNQRLKSLLSAHPDVDSSKLELEVLETSALEDVNHVSTIMNSCIDLGVKFSLDDFGTGYSSLTYLRRLPVDLIKIDQSFVRDMLSDPEDLAIVEGVITLGNLFERRVIAEGVETIEHGTALLKMGCDLAQGYGIARPMPADEIPQWTLNWQADNSWSI